MLERSPQSVLRAAKANAEAFALGCQGPDPFFYAYLPGAKNKFLHRIANRLHTENVDAFMAAMLRSSKQDPLRLSYFLGYLSHYALDAAAHPYVNHLSCRPDHTRFEAHLDSALLSYLGVKLREHPPDGLLQASEQTVLAIDELLTLCAAESHGLDLAGDFVIAHKHMLRVQRIGFDPSRIKRPLFLLAETFLKKPAYITGKLLETRVTDGIDYLNLKKRPWSLPWDPGAVHTDSFLEIVERAAVDAAEMALAVVQSGPGDEAEALKIIGARSFDTGLDWRTPAPSVNVRCVYKSHKSD